MLMLLLIKQEIFKNISGLILGKYEVTLFFHPFWILPKLLGENKLVLKWKSDDRYDRTSFLTDDARSSCFQWGADIGVDQRENLNAHYEQW